jgi:hypothetical protein
MQTTESQGKLQHPQEGSAFGQLGVGIGICLAGFDESVNDVNNHTVEWTSEEERINCDVSYHLHSGRLGPRNFTMHYNCISTHYSPYQSKTGE